jgi:putative endonuclease
MTPDYRKRLGAFGETYAAHFLARRGYAIVDRNVRYPVGEIDIVAKDEGEYVFVEVKTRRSTEFGLPEDALTAARRAHLDSAIDCYLDTLGRDSAPYRVEVVAIEIGRGGRVTRCEIVDNLGVR